MKKVRMRVQRFGDKGWYEDKAETFERVSRWIKVQTNYAPTKQNSLWDYAMDGYGRKPYQGGFDKSEGLSLDYFTFGGRRYAIEQFLRLGNPFWVPVTYYYEDKDGKLCYLCGVDGEDIFNPIYIECDEYLERVRVYRKERSK